MDKREFKTIRQANGYTQRELASYLDMTPEHISRIENGHSGIGKVLALAMSGLKKK